MRFVAIAAHPSPSAATALPATMAMRGQGLKPPTVAQAVRSTCDSPSAAASSSARRVRSATAAMARSSTASAANIGHGGIESVGRAATASRNTCATSASDMPTCVASSAGSAPPAQNCPPSMRSPNPATTNTAGTIWLVSVSPAHQVPMTSHDSAPPPTASHRIAAARDSISSATLSTPSSTARPQSDPGATASFERKKSSAILATSSVPPSHSGWSGFAHLLAATGTPRNSRPNRP